MLSSLWGGIKNVGSAIGGALSNIGSYLGSQTASAFGSFTGPLSPTQQRYNPGPKPPLQIYEVKNDGFAYGQNNANVIRYDNGKQGTTFINAQTPGSAGQQSLATSQAGGVRPSTFSTKKASERFLKMNTDSQGRVSTADIGAGFFNEKGEFKISDVNFGGTQGTGGSGVTIGDFGATGTSGLGIPSGFRGAGGGTAGSGYGVQEGDEEERKSDTRTGTQNLAPAPDPTQQAFNTLGAYGQQDPTGTPIVPEVFAMETIQSTREALNQLNTGSFSEQDKQTVYAQLQNNLLTAKAKLDQLNPIPDNPVVDTPAQLEFINQSDDPFGVQQYIDEFKARETNLGVKEAQLADVNNTITAMIDSYKPIIDDIRRNPNLPKALARRRIEDLAFSQKEALTGLLREKENLVQEVENENKEVDRALGLLDRAEDRQQRAITNARAQLSLYSSNPHLLLGMSPAQIKAEAAALGVKAAGLQALQDKALEPDVDIVTNEFADGSLKAIDKNTGKVIWSLSGAGGGSSGGGETFKSGGLTVSGSKIAQAEQTLLGSRGEDGFVNPVKYLELYEDWVDGDGLVSDFKKQFPPEEYVNPANEWLPKEIMPKNRASAAI